MGPSRLSGSPALSMMGLRIKGITWPDSSNCVVFLEFGLVSLDLLNAPAGRRLDQSVLDDESLTVVLATTTSSSACPLCDFDSSRVRSRYTRRFADLPCFGRAVQLHVAVRRFFCSELSVHAASSPSAYQGLPRRMLIQTLSFGRPMRRLVAPSAASQVFGSPYAWPSRPARTRCCGAWRGSVADAALRHPE